ncbi:integrin beta-1-like [Corticium candelabrum]|uniref:integrin beta-1-like n=1 Tax=Corticium candelabrum TaxID=121492 RepID=UPI002E256151|nr:integrin beta-1-like [Corticium candelabrum]
MWLNVVALTLACYILTSQGQDASEALCMSQTTCTLCVSASADCAWCFDEEVNTKFRCRPVSSWHADRSCRNVSNPRSTVTVLQGNQLSDTVQVYPQQVNISLRPGETVNFNVSIRPAENFPVDLYYLMDLSYSMRDDLESLKLLGGDLASALRNKTSNLRLGFGTFVDKTIDPYIDLAHINDPCGGNLCRRPFPFINNLPLTEKTQDFVKKVNNESISGNLDFPEGGMDALMQVVVCGNKIGWRKNARRIVVMATDAGFHFAGDGKLGGAVQPHDGNCYLDKSGAGGKYMEEKAKTLDYPSIGHLNDRLVANDIIPVFAVVSNYIRIYNNLVTQLTGAFTGPLARDSANVVKLIEDIYNKIVSNIFPTIPTHHGITIGVNALCSEISTGTPEVKECVDVRLGQEVTFMFDITAASCEDIRRLQSDVIGIRFVGFGDLSIAVTPVCNCDCEEQAVTNSSKCEGGTLTCATCECVPGRFGDECECTQENAEDASKCRPANSTDDSGVCNNNGECVCGRCICSENFIGDQCECDEKACRQYNGFPCGGVERGTCSCHTSTLTPKCNCELGYSGSDCSCSTSQDACKTPKEDNQRQLCNDEGVCMCNQCECYDGFSGHLCTPPGCTADETDEECQQRLQEQGPCFRSRDCAECLGFRSGPKASNCSIENDCIESKTQETEKNAYRIDACVSTNEKKCTFFYEVVRNLDNSLHGIYVHKESVNCPDSFPYVPLILGLVFGLAALVLIPLLIWKLLTGYLDGMEYKRFQEERAKAKWSKEQNPMYKEPVQKNVNPAYGKA